MKLTVGRKIFFSFAIIMALLLEVTIFVTFSFDKVEKSADQIIYDAIPISQKTSSLLTDLVNQETGVRGYVATGEKMYLEPYHAGKESIRTTLDEIDLLLHNYPIMAELINKAKPQIFALDEYFQSLIDLVDNGNLELARSVVSDGKILFDSYRETHAEITRDIAKIIEDSHHGIVDSQSSAVVMISSVLVFALAITILLALLLIRSISRPVKKASLAMTRIAEGDLTVEEIKTKNKDEIGVMIHTFNQMVRNLKDLVSAVGDNSDHIAAMSEQLSSSTDQNMLAIEHITSTMEEIATGSNTQADSVEDTKHLVNNLSDKISELTRNAMFMSDSSIKASESANDGHKHIDEAVKQMQEIDLTVNNSAEVVSQLGEQIQEIGSIVGVINSIANQTNLLALNAAIEAARAGEAGRGFSVVAEEVRVLAEQSTTATKNISSIIATIQEGAEKAITEMGKGTTAVNKGSEIVGLAGGAFNQILTSIKQLSDQIKAATHAMEDINRNSENMVSNMNQVSKITQVTASGTQTALSSIEEQAASMEEITAASNTLAGMAEELQSVVGKFNY